MGARQGPGAGRGEVGEINLFSAFHNMIFVIDLVVRFVAGLQHAHSLGNIGVSSQHTTNSYSSSRNYESDDENMTRKKTRPIGSGLYLKPSVYSKGDIREQVRSTADSPSFSYNFLLFDDHFRSAIFLLSLPRATAFFRRRNFLVSTR